MGPVNVTLALSADDVRLRLIQRREIALLDVREEGPYAEAHPLFAASLPLSRIELEVLDRLPRKTVPIVVYDQGEGLAQRASEILSNIGYRNISLLEGGLAGWCEAGAEVFRDVNVPSKAFGELVEARRHTPSIGADDLNSKLQAGENLVVLDARPFEEYRTMSIPSATSVPGGELVLRVRELAPDDDTLVVVNCAGRTRSIIGTQSLINAGVPNPVAALRNGTIGWTLAGLRLDHGQSRRYSEVTAESQSRSANAARALADIAGVGRIDRNVLAEWKRDPTRTLYLFDVRTPDEYLSGHLPGFRSAPGGQLVQETDVFAPVRGSRIVLADHDGVRANMSASWLAQMGWDVSVLSDIAGEKDWEQEPFRPRLPPPPPITGIGVEALAALVTEQQVTIIDFGRSTEYGRGHLPGAWFALRSQLASVRPAVSSKLPIVLTSSDGALAAYVAPELERRTGLEARVLVGGTAAWIAAGHRVETGLTRTLAPAIDAYKRPYEGTDNPHAAMQAYLDWELGLVAQLERDGTHHFHVI
jgi:rhodanese-related sulfurtransferase